MAKTTWLQVTGQSPRPFKTKKAATEAFTLELERFTAEGWLKAWGTLASGVMVLERAGSLTALVVSTVDAEGYDTDPLCKHRRVKDCLRSATGVVPQRESRLSAAPLVRVDEGLGL